MLVKIIALAKEIEGTILCKSSANHEKKDQIELFECIISIEI